MVEDVSVFGNVMKLHVLRIYFRSKLDYKGQISTAHLELPEEQRRRFEIECEFVQSLANPHYLNCRSCFKMYRKIPVLAQRGYFKEDYFVSYLKYLLYWKKPEYSRFVPFVSRHE